MLKANEAVFATVTNASLIDERRGTGHFTGASSGVSIPIGSLGGHAVRYHVGATRVHYVPAPAVRPPSTTATVIHYGTHIAGWFDFPLNLALAQFKGTVLARLARLAAARPHAPAATP